MLLQRMGRAVDVFRQLDTDHSNTISLTEFERAVSTLGLPASADIHALWKELDADNSGEIVYHELLAVLNPSATADGVSEVALDPTNSKSRFHYTKADAEDAARLIDRTEYRTTPYALEVHAGQAARAYNSGGHARDSRITKFVPKEYKVGRLPGFDLGGSSGAADVKERLRAAMTDVANVRVIDVFRAWDTDQSVCRRPLSIPSHLHPLSIPSPSPLHPLSIPSHPHLYRHPSPTPSTRPLPCPKTVATHLLRSAMLCA